MSDLGQRHDHWLERALAAERRVAELERELAVHREGLFVAANERAQARRERDEARAELDHIALESGYGERPEGQGHVIRADGETLASEFRRAQAAARERDEWREAAEAGAAMRAFPPDGVYWWGEVRRSPGVVSIVVRWWALLLFPFVAWKWGRR